MFTANFLDYLSQPDYTRYFQATAPSSNLVARGGRLFSLLKLGLISNFLVHPFFLPALFDNSDFSVPHPVIDVVVACPEFHRRACPEPSRRDACPQLSRRDEVQLLIREPVVRRRHPVDFVEDGVGRA